MITIPHLARRALVLLVLLGVIGGTTISTATAEARWPGPAMVSQEVLEDPDIPSDGNMHTVAYLDLAPGDWFVQVTTKLAYLGAGRCSLGYGPRIQELHLKSPTTPFKTGYTASLMEVVTITARTGRVRFRCGMVDDPWSSISLWSTRLDAMRVGQLTSVDLVGATASTTGSGKPVVKIGRRDQSRTIAQDTVQLGSLKLDAGLWWIQAVVPLRHHLVAGHPEKLFVSCHLVAGRVKDVSRTGVASTDRARPAGLQVVTRLAVPGAVKVACRVLGRVGEAVSGDVRVVAMRIGTLIRAPMFGSVTKVGSGLPVLVSVTRMATVQPEGEVFRTLTTLPKGAVAGKRWRVLATSQMDGPGQYWDTSTCKLRATGGQDLFTGTHGTWLGGISVVHAIIADLRQEPHGTARFACTGEAFSEDTILDYSRSRMVALRIASLKVQPHP